MLNVKTPQEVADLIKQMFSVQGKYEIVPLIESLGRVLARDILSEEYVPDFNRSMVDGYAVLAADTFGCSDSMPALLEVSGEVLMGQKAALHMKQGSCVAVPTGGDIPEGADSVVMIEYTEDYGDGSIGVLKPTTPGLNMIFRGDDVKPGECVLQKGKMIQAQDIGAMAAIGMHQVPVQKKLKVGIISTGDELIPVEEVPGPGQVRDVNSSLLAAAVQEAGAEAILFGVVKDEFDLLDAAVKNAAEVSDIVLISGGSSVGAKDATCRVIEKNGKLFFHGIAMKPGKPTIMGRVGDIPVWGLPGHPVAALFVTKLFVVPLIDQLTGGQRTVYPLTAILEEPVSANHGRAQYMGAIIHKKQGQYYVRPIRSKSGLITSLAGVSGYFGIDRDCEGLAAGSEIQVYSFV